MKRALLCLLLFPLSAPALERDLLNAVESVAGIYSSIYLHEAGHALALKAAGASQITIKVPRPGTIFSGQTSSTSAHVPTAGFVGTERTSFIVQAEGKRVRVV